MNQYKDNMNPNENKELPKYLIPVEEVHFPIEFANKQLEIFWTPEEIKVEKDIQDIRVNMDEAERNATIDVLRLFSLYETHAGDEFWSGRFKDIFNDSAFHRMASVFSMFELAVHAPFYGKINKLLAIDTEEFYRSYAQDKAMSARMQHIDEIINHPNDLVSLGGFSMVEGVILYSNFAFLKHFQSQGKNRLTNIVRGINFSVRDENLHSMGGAAAYKYKLRTSSIAQVKEATVEIYKLAQTLYQHELALIDRLFSFGEIKGIRKEDLIVFVQSRINLCLSQLGLEPVFEIEIETNPIADWFYKGINSFQFNDFFAGQGREYVRSWDEDGFVWKV